MPKAQKAKDLRDQAVEELEASYNDKCKELFQLQNELQHAKKLEKPHLVRQTKRDIARLLTVIKQKQMAK